MDTRGKGLFVRQVLLRNVTEADEYPYTLPVVRHLLELGELSFEAPVTFLVGDNGTGKSTLTEAIAVSAGFNPEGGSRNFSFGTRSSESSLGDKLTISWGTPKPKGGFFLRAESFYNVATEVERLDKDPYSGPLLPAYGGISPHERSHGESFVDLITHRFGARSLFVLDEPEAALSVHGCLAVLARMSELVRQGCQFIVATHSPILLACPGATIWEIERDGSVESVEYDMALPVQMTRAFLNAPERFLRHLEDRSDDA